MEKVFKFIKITVGVITGIGFLIVGVRLVVSGFGGLPTEKDREQNLALGEQVYAESIARGDEPWYADFLRTDTIHMSDDFAFYGKAWGIAGTVLILIAVGIFSVWWRLVLDPLIG